MKKQRSSVCLRLCVFAGGMFISFYQLIQLDPSMIRRMMGQTEDREERRRLRIAMITRSALIVVFAILFIGLMTSLFGAENSSMAVSIFCILLASRFVGFGYRISDSLFSMALCFLVLLCRTDFADIQNKKNVEVTDNGKDDF